jgi:hypothetical protein
MVAALPYGRVMRRAGKKPRDRHLPIIAHSFPYFRLWGLWAMTPGAGVPHGPRPIPRRSQSDKSNSSPAGARRAPGSGAALRWARREGIATLALACGVCFFGSGHHPACDGANPARAPTARVMERVLSQLHAGASASPPRVVRPRFIGESGKARWFGPDSHEIAITTGCAEG